MRVVTTSPIRGIPAHFEINALGQFVRRKWLGSDKMSKRGRGDRLKSLIYNKLVILLWWAGCIGRRC